MKINTVCALGAVVGALTIGPASAAYPERAITFIVPFGAGGSTDTGVRTMAPFLEECVGAPIAVVNVPGAGADIGHTQLAAAEPDGYTIGEIVTPNLLVSIITEEPRFSLDSFEHLGTIFGSASTINVRDDSAYETLDELVAASKESPLNMGLSAIGADDHLGALRFMQISGAKFNIIPLGDSATVPLALIRGDVDVAMTSLNAAARLQDQIRTLAVASKEPLDVLPGVPTFKQSGYDLVVVSTHGMGAPKGTPPEAVAKLVDCFSSIPEDPEFIEAAKARSLAISPMTPEETAASYRAELEQLQELWETNPWIK